MKRILRLVLAGGLAAGVAVALAGSAGADHSAGRTFTAAAAAIPSPGQPHDQAQDVGFHHAWGGALRITGVATTSVTCDGCVGRAVTLQVVDAGRARSLVVRNVAATWAADCTSCRGSALAIQIVTARSKAAVDAGNRALAVNAACAGCRISAAALQFVVVGGPGRTVSEAALGKIAALRAQLLAELGTTPTTPASSTGIRPAARSATPAGRAAVTDTAARIQQVLAADLPASTVTRAVEVKS